MVSASPRPHRCAGIHVDIGGLTRRIDFRPVTYVLSPLRGDRCSCERGTDILPDQLPDARHLERWAPDDRPGVYPAPPLSRGKSC